MNILALGGCKPAPLAHYLKALGLLRIVAEQVDPGVRGAWRGGRFVLLTKLSRDELSDFILRDYVPSPILSPWNGGSGFYPKDNKVAIDAIAEGSAPRFENYRKAIERAREIVGERTARPDAGPAKNELLAACLSEWEETALPWLLSSVMLDDQGEPAYPSLLGSGGNDGRLDFSTNYMQRLVQLFDPATGQATESASQLLANALFDEPSPNLKRGGIGQFNPGGAGGANSGAGFEGNPKWNPWDFVWMLEGALVLRVAGLRKLEGGHSVQASAPFALKAAARGFGTAADDEDAPRGEQWFPLWPGPASYSEVRQLFAEARLRSSKGESARGVIDAARAIGTLGVARGVEAFVRYGYLVRNGLSNLAIPTGIFAVKHQPEIRYLDEIDDFLRRIRNAGGQSTAFGQISRTLDNAALACAESPNNSHIWQLLVMALGEAEHALNARPKLAVEAFLRPIPRLSLEWFNVLDDGSPEVRLALSIATVADRNLGPIRRHAVPLDKKKRLPSLATSSEGLVHDPGVVWRHRDLASDLTAVAMRRAIENPKGLFPLWSPFPASLGDIGRFLEGGLDETRILRLARGMMSFDISRHKEVDLAPRLKPSGRPLAAHAMVRLAYPHAEGDYPKEHASGHALRLLAAGELNRASQALQRYLVSRGLRLKLRALSGSASFARRLAATVAIPISRSDHRELFKAVGHTQTSAQKEG